MLAKFYWALVCRTVILGFWWYSIRYPFHWSISNNLNKLKRIAPIRNLPPFVEEACSEVVISVSAYKAGFAKRTESSNSKRLTLRSEKSLKEKARVKCSTLSKQTKI